ncbi:MAG TPA: thiamine-binding protein [Anaerolineales bacterium]|nr:thiamine-binding protein [Anaerolineales bacterium]
MALDPNRTVNVAVQVLPLAADPYPLIERAIAVIQASGVTHEVDAMETVMEGPLDRLLEVARQAHLACMEGGAEQAVTIIKIADRRSGTTIAGKVDRYRS